MRDYRAQRTIDMLVSNRGSSWCCPFPGKNPLRMRWMDMNTPRGGRKTLYDGVFTPEAIRKVRRMIRKSAETDQTMWNTQFHIFDKFHTVVTGNGIHNALTNCIASTKHYFPQWEGSHSFSDVINAKKVLVNGFWVYLFKDAPISAVERMSRQNARNAPILRSF